MNADPHVRLHRSTRPYVAEEALRAQMTRTTTIASIVAPRPMIVCPNNCTWVQMCGHCLLCLHRTLSGAGERASSSSGEDVDGSSTDEKGDGSEHARSTRPVSQVGRRQDLCQVYGASRRRVTNEHVTPVEPVRSCARDARKVHPTSNEWRAEMLSEESLRDAFFGLSHKCSNLVTDASGREVQCHVGLWAMLRTGWKLCGANVSPRLQNTTRSFAEGTHTHTPSHAPHLSSSPPPHKCFHRQCEHRSIGDASVFDGI